MRTVDNFINFSKLIFLDFFFIFSQHKFRDYIFKLFYIQKFAIYLQ
jgi:hypothetical protein